MITLPLRIANQLARLSNGEKIPGSMLKHPAIEEMIDNGVLRRQLIGRSRSVICLHNKALLDIFLKNHFGINNLEQYVYALTQTEISRQDAIIASSDSKVRAIRTFRGFPLNCLYPVNCMMKNEPIIINPMEGAFLFIHDYENLVPDPEVTIVGVENSENFVHLKKQKNLFDNIHPLFVSRYPQSKDLIRWLTMIPNNYLHFGDLDIAGLNIYFSEFKKHLGDKAGFFLPQNAESLFIKFGNRALYDNQSACFDIDQAEKEVNTRILISLINKYKKGVEQEILIG
jgi:hypothetical protein